ncbi:MAG TPA: GDSL-type esterase/lipase family protein [Prolixibacteraceae bacterium]|nr:GDSL-type esterase/lipase family protein [Prolixibacteraceae bacterium]
MRNSLRFVRLMTVLYVSMMFLASCAAPKVQTQAGSKWAGEIAAFDKLNQTEKYSDQSILFVGSSSIRLWSTIKEEMAPYPVIQRGFGGSNSPGVLQYIEQIAYPHQFRAVVIFIANDITGSPNDLTPKQSTENFRQIVKVIRAKYKKQPVFIVEITPSQSRWKKWPLIQENNANLKALCNKEKNLYFIETAQSFLNDKGEPRNELFKEDHLHLNRDGYLIWGKLIKAEVDKRMKEKG